ncbi:hypothetical protein ACLOJK_005036 [Asimina triloba]
MEQQVGEHYDGICSFSLPFQVQTTKVQKLCKSNQIVTVNGMYPGPVLHAQEDDRVIVKVTNESPHNATIHWHGVRQQLSCWSDGPSYITQCPIQPGQSFTYEFTLVQQKGTLLWHAHISWLRATVHGAFVVYPKTGDSYPFPTPYEEQVIVLAEYWNRDPVSLERAVLESGGAPPLIRVPYDVFSDVYQLNVDPGKRYLLRIISAALNIEHFFRIANHKLTIVEADGEYTKAVMVEQITIAPGQTINVLITTDQPIGRYSMAMGPYMSARNVAFQSTPAVAYLQYAGATTNTFSAPTQLPSFNDNLAAKRHMDSLRALKPLPVPLEIDENLFFTVGVNVEQCHPSKPNKTCQGPNNGSFAASMNNVTFVRPPISILEAYYYKIRGYFTKDFPGVPLRIYDFVNGAPNNIPKDTQSVIGTRVKVLDYGSRVQLVLQDTGTVSTENHPIHLHGYSFYVVGYGSGDYNPKTASLNLVDPPYMNTIGVPVGGWAVIRFVADNPGVWFMHCHLDIHTSWGLSMVFIVRDGTGKLEMLPHPPADMPRC